MLISLGARTDCEADWYSLPTADPYSLPTVLKSDAASENAVDVLADIFVADMDTVLADMDAAAPPNQYKNQLYLNTRRFIDVTYSKTIAKHNGNQ